MTALLPRWFGDVSDWFDIDFGGRVPHLIKVEDQLSETEYRLRAELPGLDPDKDVQLNVSQGTLTIRAERKEQEKLANRTEFRYGMLHRMIRLPANAAEDKITATYDKGVLEVIVPLTAPESTGRQVPITAG